MSIKTRLVRIEQKMEQRQDRRALPTLPNSAARLIQAGVPLDWFPPMVRMYVEGLTPAELEELKNRPLPKFRQHATTIPQVIDRLLAAGVPRELWPPPLREYADRERQADPASGLS